MENVDIVTLKALYECLEVDGEVSEHRGDYDERMGLTQNPITSFDVHTFPILHAVPDYPLSKWGYSPGAHNLRGHQTGKYACGVWSDPPPPLPKDALYTKETTK